MRTSSAEARVVLTARSVGCRVPEGGFEFRVHSVFRSALNLRPAGSSRLVTLVGDDADALPQGIRLSTREVFDAWPVAAGATGRRRGDTLEFDESSDGAPPRVDLRDAERSPRRALRRARPWTPAADAAWQACATWLDAEQARTGADLRLAAVCGDARPLTSMGERLAAAGRALGEAVRGADADAADRAASRLLGLGGGLTPAGDDFLCGVLAALACTCAPGDEDDRVRPAWTRSLARRLDATNAISATFLACAIEGCFTGALSGFADAFGIEAGKDGVDGPRAACARLCATGHSSGMDAATGFLSGLRWRNDRESRRHAA